MFGMNEIVGKNYFKEEPDNTLVITSRFYTLQGEGPWRGYPAVFIRLAKCNLACSFCDTYFDSGERYTFDEIFEQIEEEIANFYKRHNMDIPSWAQPGDQRELLIVLTGGEPTLQSNMPAFLDAAHERNFSTQIESNGILFPENFPYRTTYVVSPKCLEKNNQAVRYLTPNADVLARADCLKFVMSAPTDQFSPYSEVPEWAHEWAQTTGREVFVSPMNIYRKEPQRAKEIRQKTNDISIVERSEFDERISFWEPDLLDMEANQRNHEYAAEYAMKHGFVLNLQTHLYANLP